MPFPQQKKKRQCQRRPNTHANHRQPQPAHAEPATLYNDEDKHRDARNEDIGPSERGDVGGGRLLQQQRHVEAVRR